MKELVREERGVREERREGGREEVCMLQRAENRTYL